MNNEQVWKKLGKRKKREKWNEGRWKKKLEKYKNMWLEKKKKKETWKEKFQ